MSLQVSSVSTVSDPEHKFLRTELKKKKAKSLRFWEQSKQEEK